MNDALTIACFVTAALVVLLRFTVPGHGLSWAGTYEAFAHIWVGVVAAIVVYERDWVLGAVWAGAAVFELFMFLTRKRRGAVT